MFVKILSKSNSFKKIIEKLTIDYVEVMMPAKSNNTLNFYFKHSKVFYFSTSFPVKFRRGI